jgi:sortase (surface protein transpeptidase)
MNELLSDAPEKTVIIMTCAGDPLPNQDATHRLIITATLAE